MPAPWPVHGSGRNGVVANTADKGTVVVLCKVGGKHCDAFKALQFDQQRGAHGIDLVVDALRDGRHTNENGLMTAWPTTRRTSTKSNGFNKSSWHLAPHFPTKKITPNNRLPRAQAQESPSLTPRQISLRTRQPPSPPTGLPERMVWEPQRSVHPHPWRCRLS